MSTSIAGFLGETERGPTTPTLVTSYIQYQRLFGSNFNEEKYLPYAVQGFFENGGQRCYISRIVNTNAVTSSTEFTIGLKTFHIEANGEGAWGNGLAVKVTEDTSPQTPTLKKYKLSIFYWKNPAPAIFDPEAEPLKKPRPTIETYDDVEFDKNQEYYDKKINSSSDLVRIKIITDPSHNLTPATLPLITFLQNGTDSTTANSTPILEDYTRNDTATQGKKKGLTGLNKIDEISILYAPNADKVAGLVKKLITDCETLKNHFLILDIPKTNSISWINTKGRYNTSYAAYYYPWIKVADPGTGKPRTIPPGGHVAGVYARADVERGVHKAPASEVVHGVIGLEFNMGRGEQDIPNARGVNCIRQFPGRGYQIWGERTLSDDTLWKYINVRRLFIYLEESIVRGTQWVVFEPNDERLWARVIGTITQFLTSVWRDGALMGATPEEAFFVRCDRSTMTQNDIDEGRLIVLIGVAPLKPAEFVILHITQC